MEKFSISHCNSIADIKATINEFFGNDVIYKHVEDIALLMVDGCHVVKDRCVTFFDEDLDIAHTIRAKVIKCKGHFIADLRYVETSYKFFDLTTLAEKEVKAEPETPEETIKRAFAELDKLTDDEKQILADTIHEGVWGDCDMDFVGGTDMSMGYCTNDAKNAGHFPDGRKRSALFRSIYKKLGMLGKGHGATEFFAYHNDWWGDGTGDMFFIRTYGIDLDEKFEEWARNYNK